MAIISGVYVIRNKNNNKMYIGSSIDVRDRWRHHKSELRNNRHGNPYLQKAWRKHGEDAFECFVLEKCDDKCMRIREEFWIEWYQSSRKPYGYNLTAYTLQPALGRKHTPEELKAMSERGKGRKHTPETLKRMSEVNLGKKHSEESRLKMSLSKRGIPKTEEWKQKASVAAKNRSPESERNRAKSLMKRYIVTSPAGIIFDIVGLKDFCKEYGLNYPSLCMVVSGALKHYKGWKCRKA